MLLYHSNIDRDEVFKILYDKAFFGKVNHRLQEIFPFDWFDPDCGYDDDYLSWKSKLDDVAIEIKRMLREKEY